MHYQLQATYFNDFNEDLMSKIAEVQKKAQQSVLKKTFTEADFVDRDKIMEAEELICRTVCKCLAFVKCALNNAKLNYGACQEISEISAAFLFTLFGVGSQRLLDVEIVGIELDHYGSHAFLVLNRKPESSLEEVADWGDRCLVFDPQNKWVSTVKNLPLLASIRAIRDKEYTYPIRIITSFNNFLSFDTLTPFANHSRYGELVKIRLSIYPDYIIKTMKLMLAEIGLDNSKVIKYLKIDERLPFSMQELAQLCDSLFPLMQHKPAAQEGLEAITGLTFRSFVSSDYKVSCITKLPDANAETKAIQLISDMHYGKIVTTRCGQKMLFFSQINESRHATVIHQNFGKLNAK